VLVFSTTGSTLLAAVTFGIGFLPQIIGGTLLGSLADRLSPRRLITAGYLLEAATATVLGALVLPVGVSLALVALVAAVTPVFGGASSRLVAEVLTGDAYVLGRSLSNVASAGAQLVGLGAGGLVVAALGSRHALLVGAACHLVAAAGVRTLLPRLAVPVRAAGSAVRQSWSTTVGLVRDPVIRPLLLLQWVPPAFATGAEALIVPYVAYRDLPAGAVGPLMACVPAGMLAADLAVGRLLRPNTRERLVAPLILLLGGALLGLAAPVPLIVVAVLLGLVGCSLAYSLGLQRRFLDALPAGHRGQAFALLSTGLMTLQGLGPAAFGALGEFATIPAALMTAGAATALVPLLFLRRSPSPTPAPPPTPALHPPSGRRSRAQRRLLISCKVAKP
jgi:MFS family permease